MTIENVIIFDLAGATGPGLITLEELEARGRNVEAEHPQLSNDLAHAAKPDDLATLFIRRGRPVNLKA